MRVERHPKLNIWVREDGCVYVPQNYHSAAHWTFGSKRPNGYSYVRIGGKNYSVHRLVAETFLGPIPEGYEVDHINRNRSDNRAFENLRIVTRSDNMRNRADHDRVEARGGTHYYEDEKQAIREWNAQYYAENNDKERERQACYRQAKRNTHRVVRFSDGSYHWIPHAEADAYLIIPLKERHYGK